MRFVDNLLTCHEDMYLGIFAASGSLKFRHFMILDEDVWYDTEEFLPEERCVGSLAIF